MILKIDKLITAVLLSFTRATIYDVKKGESQAVDIDVKNLDFI